MHHIVATLLLFWLLLSGCGPQAEPLPVPDGVPATSSPWLQPQPPVCPEMHQGTGAVWLDDPADMTLQQRPLHCLTGDGRLHGSFVTNIAPTGTPAQGPHERYFFDLDDPRLQQVQVYYALTGMAGHFQPAIEQSGVLPGVQVELRPQDTFTISRYDWPDRLRIAAGGVSPERMVPLQVLCHEYGHHLILNQGSQLDPVVNEGMADYLAADFTGNPRILSLERLQLPADLPDDPTGLDIARRYLERSVDNQRTYPADVVTQGDYCAVLTQAATIFPQGSPLVPTQKVEQCKNMSAGELARPEGHRSGMIVGGALWELRGKLGSSTVNGLLFAVLAAGGQLGVEDLGPALLQADRARHNGAHAAVLQAVLQARGLR